MSVVFVVVVVVSLWGFGVMVMLALHNEFGIVSFLLSKNSLKVFVLVLLERVVEVNNEPV